MAAYGACVGATVARGEGTDGLRSCGLTAGDDAASEPFHPRRRLPMISATRSAFATIVRLGFTPPQDGKNDASTT